MLKEFTYGLIKLEHGSRRSDTIKNFTYNTMTMLLSEPSLNFFYSTKKQKTGNETIDFMIKVKKGDLGR